MQRLGPYFLRLFALMLVFAAAGSPALGEPEQPFERFFLLNVHAAGIEDETFRTIKQLNSSAMDGAPRLGIGSIISYLRSPRAENVAFLRKLLELSRKHRLAVLIQLDGEQWWQNRPDLWNWWDVQRPGFDPENASNVEWSGWGPEHALKISWRDWGEQLRVLPPPNLMSSRYREACHAEMRVLIQEILRWQKSLLPDEQWLLVGVKVGWESAIGMGNYYYPNGNALINSDPASDPDQKIQSDILPGRGFQPIGYAAVTTAKLARDGELKEVHLAEVIRRHLDDLAQVARSEGLRRDQIFTHCGGWAEGELLYAAALNANSCPGWSFYRHARDPSGDKTAMAALVSSDAPYWAATEWKPIGARNAEEWCQAIQDTLRINRCRYVCAFNWRGIHDNPAALEGIRRALSNPIRLP